MVFGLDEADRFFEREMLALYLRFGERRIAPLEVGDQQRSCALV